MVLTGKVGPDVGRLRTYDAFYCSIGYEQRSIYFLEKMASRALELTVWPFERNRTLSYNANIEAARDFGANIVELVEAEFGAGVEDALISLARQLGRPPQIAFDISSSSRNRIAAIFSAIRRHPELGGLRVDFLYSPAKFSKPPEGGEVMQEPSPVNVDFRGSFRDPALPLCLIIGLGYEPDRGLGVIELLEPERTIAFVPRGKDPRYDKAVQTINTQLFQILEDQQSVDYPVWDPVEMYRRIESAAFSAAAHHRVVIVPLGPKMFAVAAMLASFNHGFRHAVWRVSPGDWSRPRTAVASGFEVVFPVHFVAGSDPAASSR